MLQKIVEEALIGLREELAAINKAIGAMEHLRRLRPTKGRPPKDTTFSVYPVDISNVSRRKYKHKSTTVDNFSIVDPGFKPSRKKKKSKLSAATRKKMAAAQKKRWAQAKKNKVIQMRKKKVA